MGQIKQLHIDCELGNCLTNQEEMCHINNEYNGW